jgi:hypothetical protein
MNYICNLCNYSSNRQNNYERHINSSKHQNSSNNKNAYAANATEFSAINQLKTTTKVIEIPISTPKNQK